MRILRVVGVALALVAASLVSAAPADAAVEIPRGAVAIGNGFFSVHLQYEAGLGAGIGSFTVLTGPLHPAGEGRNVLYGDGYPGASHITVESDGGLYTTSDLGPGERLDAYFEGAAWFDNYSEFRFDPFPELCSAASGDDQCDIRIFQIIEVTGTTLASSAVVIRVGVAEQASGSSQGGSAIEDIEVNVNLDYQIAADDGPTFQATGGPLVTGESTYAPPTLGGYRIQDNPLVAPSPTFAVKGVVAPDPVLGPFNVVPDRLDFLCWPDAVQDLPAYEPTPGRDITSPGSDCDQAHGDSAVRARWSFQVGTSEAAFAPVFVTTSFGHSAPGPGALATKIAATGGTRRMLFGGMRFENLRATLRRVDNNAVVPGQSIAFTVGGYPVCTAVTNTAGVATCGGVVRTRPLPTTNRYVASFGGVVNTYLASQGTGVLTLN